MFIEVEIYTREMEEVSLITVLCKDIHVQSVLFKIVL